MRKVRDTQSMKVFTRGTRDGCFLKALLVIIHKTREERERESEDEGKVERASCTV